MTLSIIAHRGVELANDDFILLAYSDSNDKRTESLAIGNSIKYEITKPLIDTETFCNFKVMSSDGNFYYCYYEGLSYFFNSEISVFDIKNRSKLKTFPVIDGVRGLAVSPDNQQIYLSTSTGFVQLWNIESETFVKQFSGHTASIKSIELSPNNQYLLTASEDKPHEYGI